MSAYGKFIRGSGVVIFCLFTLFTTVMFVLCLADNMLKLGWGFKWIDTILSMALTVFAVGVILLSRFLLKIINFK